MRNPFTFEVEGWLGASFIGLLGVFLVATFFIVFKNFNTDVDTLNANPSIIKGISPTERTLIDTWVAANGVQIPEGKGYRYIIDTYPDKPWFKLNE